MIKADRITSPRFRGEIGDGLTALILPIASTAFVQTRERVFQVRKNSPLVGIISTIFKRNVGHRSVAKRNSPSHDTVLHSLCSSDFIPPPLDDCPHTQGEVKGALRACTNQYALIRPSPPDIGAHLPGSPITRDTSSAQVARGRASICTTRRLREG